MDISAQAESKAILIFPLLLPFTLKGWGDVLLLLCMGEGLLIPKLVYAKNTPMDTIPKLVYAKNTPMDTIRKDVSPALWASRSPVSGPIK